MRFYFNSKPINLEITSVPAKILTKLGENLYFDSDTGQTIFEDELHVYAIHNHFNVVISLRSPDREIIELHMYRENREMVNNACNSIFLSSINPN